MLRSIKRRRVPACDGRQREAMGHCIRPALNAHWAIELRIAALADR